MLKEIAESNIINIEQACTEHWDVVIVGGGMGGGCAASTLANAGLKVLILDKGAANFLGAGESVTVEPDNEEQQYINGKWPTRIRTAINGKVHDMWAPLGCGVGGSTLLYAAALQRFRASDFEEKETPDGTKIGWPFDYSDIEPYYQHAETVFSICGTDDPLDHDASANLLPPPAMCEQDQHLFQSFREAGFNPYRLHVGMKYKKGCEECGGRICPRACKRDAYNSCIVPALSTGNLFISEYAEAVKLNAKGTRVTSVVIKQNEKESEISGTVIVLATGAFFTPLLLKRSHNNDWPNGLANSSGELGKNLMFHASDFLGVWPKQKCSRVGPNKTIALRDLYKIDGKKVGELQSTGLAADFGLIMYALRAQFDQSIFAKIKPLRHLLRIPAYIASKLYGDATVFTTIIEDFPYPENQVVEDLNAPSGMRFEYTVHDELASRVKLMRNSIKSKMKGQRIIPLNLTIDLNYGHPCGTARAGDDKNRYVVDKNCKAHDLDNLYIVDASIMPTSGGTNPSLTIAANAFRVAEVIAKSFSEKQAS